MHNRLKNHTLMLTALMIIFIFAGARTAWSAPEFSIAPPPIPWFEFQQKQIDLKISLSYLNMSSDDYDMKVNGGGGTLNGRYAFNNTIAVDASSNWFGGGGDVGDWGIGMFMWMGMIDIEAQVMNTKQYNVLLFFGVFRGYASVSIYEITTDVNLYGPQFGIQVSIKLGSITLSPFFMFQSVNGDYSASNGASDSIDSFSMQSIGFDIVFVPLNLTLSSLLQNKPSSDSSVQSIFITLTYDFQWGGGRDADKGKESVR